MNYSAESAEAIVRAAIGEAAAKSLDAAVFSDEAAADERPAGLLNNVTPIAATAGGGTAALTGDLKALVSAIVTAGGGMRVMLFAHPARALALQILAGPAFTMPIVQVTTLDEDTLVAIEVGAIATAFTGVPEITASTQAVLHFEGSAPADIGIETGTTPATAVSAPARSAFQHNFIALRMILRCAWATRMSGAVQVIEGVTW